MKRTKQPDLPKLTLARQTLRELDQAELARAAGGRHTDACHGTGSRFC